MGFHVLTLVGSLGSCFSMRWLGRVKVKHIFLDNVFYPKSLVLCLKVHGLGSN